MVHSWKKISKSSFSGWSSKQQVVTFLAEVTYLQKYHQWCWCHNQRDSYWRYNPNQVQIIENQLSLPTGKFLESQQAWSVCCW